MSVQRYDYIIVGAGSSGCVLANRLSAHPGISVLLVEAGAGGNWLVSMPRGLGKLLVPGNPRLWTYDSVQSADGQAGSWIKGRTLGGSSAINGMLYARGHPSDYDRWQRAGCSGWGWDDMARAFTAMESLFNTATGERQGHGPLKVTLRSQSDNPLSEAFIAAGEAIGLPRLTNNNEATDGGVGYQPATIWRGRRQSAASAFLDPVRGRPNLDIASNTLATRIEFEDRRAVGVWLEGPKGRRLVGANREIILAAGSIETPKLLQLSGVGAGSLLQSLAIPVVANRPQVGENLREHFIVPSIYRVTDGSLNREFRNPRLVANVLRYLTLHSGPMASAVADVVAYAKTDPALDRPDVQIGLGLQSMLPSDVGMEVENKPGISLVSYLMHPQSRGRVWIKSADFAHPPGIDPNFLDADVDRTTAVRLLRLLRRLMSQRSIQPYVVEEVLPGPSVRDDDTEILDFVRRAGSTGYHVSSTCRMGSDDDAVVDPRLRVRGVTGLRIADTSVMPDLTSGNTNGPAMAIGWRAADFVLSGG